MSRPTAGRHPKPAYTVGAARLPAHPPAPTYAASVEILAILRKPEAAKVEVNCKYVGFDIPPDFVVGYGLDFNEKYRNLAFVGVLAKHMYS